MLKPPVAGWSAVYVLSHVLFACEVYGQCTSPACLYVPDNDLPDIRINASASVSGEYLCLFGGANDWDCATEECMISSVDCLDTAQGTRWIGGFDPIPDGYNISGRQFAAPLQGRIVVLMAGAYQKVGVAPSASLRDILIWDMNAASGSQWKIFPGVLPEPRARMQAIYHQGIVLFAGGVTVDENGEQTVSNSMFEWSLDSPQVVTRQAGLPVGVVDFALVSNSDHIYILGGRRPNANPVQWESQFFRYTYSSNRWDRMTPEPPVRIPYIRSTMFGNTLFATGDIWSFSDSMPLYMWNAATNHWSQVDLAVPASARDIRSPIFAGLPPNGGSGSSPSMYMFGGIRKNETHTFAVSTSGHISTSVVVPSFTCSPESPVVGDSIDISLSGISPEAFYSIRVSQYPDCSSRLPTTEDSAYPSDSPYVVTVRPEVAAPRAYVCFSLGACPAPTNATPCTLPPIGGQCATGCCGALPECRAKVLGSPFFSLNFLPLAISSQPVKPPGDGLFGLSRSSALYFWIPSGVVAVSFCTMAILVTRRRKPAGAEGPDSKYDLVSKLGSGAYGVVYLVRRRADKVLLAMKYIPCSSSEEQDEAMREFSVMRQLQRHPNMIKVLETTLNWVEDADGQDDRLLSADKRTKDSFRPSPRYVCLIMPYFPEGDLRGFVLSHHCLPFETVLNFVGQLANCLDYMHTMSPPLVHRDLKPENVLMADNGTKLVVTDFGLTTSVDANEYCRTQAGTLPYIAPECWERRYGTEVDLWALGCICYATATRRVEHKNTRMMFTDVLRLGQKKFEESIEEDLLGKGYPPALVTLTCSLLQFDYRARPTAKQIQDTIGYVPSDSILSQRGSFQLLRTSSRGSLPPAGPFKNLSTKLYGTLSAPVDSEVRSYDVPNVALSNRTSTGDMLPSSSPDEDSDSFQSDFSDSIVIPPRPPIFNPFTPSQASVPLYQKPPIPPSPPPSAPPAFRKGRALKKLKPDAEEEYYYPVGAEGGVLKQSKSLDDVPSTTSLE
ncbi:Serine/threonine-protein kinase nekl-2 [Diplonema papillatum]|nr:Serine/threonine-protein kinase nekl-2 [Diplonema papillatum]